MYKFYDNLKALNCVEQIWLFGSRARGSNQERADIDIAVYAPTADMYAWAKVTDIIHEADTLLSIDCVRLDELDDSSLLRQNILTEGKKIYERRSGY
jgi:predicted nucleotidyltransferase